MMGRDTRWSIFGVASLALVSLLIFGYVISGSSFVCPVLAKPDPEKYAKVIAALDQVVDLGIKLSTTLAGLGAAMLLGWKSEWRTTQPVIRFLVLLGAILFVQSALYAIWWRTGIAEAWFNNCPQLVAENRLQYRFEAHFYLFVLGLLCLGAIVVGALFTAPNADANGDVT
jgi:hypothetical protein